MSTILEMSLFSSRMRASCLPTFFSEMLNSRYRDWEMPKVMVSQFSRQTCRFSKKMFPLGQQRFHLVPGEEDIIAARRKRILCRAIVQRAGREREGVAVTSLQTILHFYHPVDRFAFERPQQYDFFPFPYDFNLLRER